MSSSAEWRFEARPQGEFSPDDEAAWMFANGYIWEGCLADFGQLMALLPRGYRLIVKIGENGRLIVRGGDNE